MRMIWSSRFCQKLSQRGRHAMTTLERTLNRLSWRTRLIAASSLDGDSFVWKTTPKDPFPTILH